MKRVQKPSAKAATGQTAQKPAAPAPATFSIDRGPVDTGIRLILAHGAGAGITSPFLESMADLLAVRGLALTLFEFTYMANRRDGGPKRPPPRAEALVDEYRTWIEALRKKHPSQTLVIGGKSLGGRVASLLAGELYEKKAIAGLVCLGYPFHPPGNPDQLRTEHLKTLPCPALIVQGERDPFGSRAEVETYRLSPKIAFAWMNDGDHDFGPRGRSGFTRKANLAAAADAVAAFVAKLSTAR
ncbi:MAG TPA: alpha/beta hydrolase [Hyphomicrobium sp.]|nr:alpha/beta hydrolase [Hyphomicrobium sp.]